MSPHDPTESSGAMHGDHPAPAGPPPTASDATRPGDFDPAGATLDAADTIPELAAVLANHGTGTSRPIR
jgi:hypothetical protein